MKRPRNVVQYSFEAGEADPQFERRADADLWGLTAKRLRNVRLLFGGGFARRPGLARVLSLSGAGRFIPFTSRAGTKRLLVVRDGAIDVVSPGETIAATITPTGIPGSAIKSLQWDQIDDRIIIASRDFYPKEIAWDEATASFAAPADLSFDDKPDSAKGWPYYRFRETRGITIAPSALTGSITLAASDDVFHADHVGTRFTLMGREVEITVVTDAKTATATVKQTLYPTYTLTVGNTSGFAPGHIVQDQVGDIEMEVAAIHSSTSLDVILVGFTPPVTTDNNLLGPNGATPLSAASLSGTPGATVQWKEQLISDYRGYPGGVVTHKDRLILYDFPQAPELHAMSVIGFPGDFDVGDGLDDEAIMEGPGDAKGKRVVHCVSAEQLISLTEVGSYYVGEGPNTPLTPANIEFLQVGPESPTLCNPIKVSEGVIFCDVNDRLMLLTPTGQLRRAWSTTELAAVAAELLNSPSRLVLVDGSDIGSERYILAVNHDGTICAIHYRRDSELSGAALWSTNGEFVDACLFNGKAYTIVKRGAAYTIERFDKDRLLDNSVLISNTSPNVPTSAALAGRTDVALVWRKAVNGEARRVDLGELFDADGSGSLTDAPTETRDYEAGSRFTPLVVPWPPIDPLFGPIEHQRVARASIDVMDSGNFYAMGQLFSAYRTADDPTEPPPLRTGWRRRKYLGRKRDWGFDLTQVEAAPLTVRALTLEVR